MKRLTYNEATALWFARHPDLIPLRSAWAPRERAPDAETSEHQAPEPEERSALPVKLQPVDPYLPYVDPDDPGVTKPPAAKCRVVITHRK